MFAQEMPPLSNRLQDARIIPAGSIRRRRLETSARSARSPLVQGTGKNVKGGMRILEPGAPVLGEALLAVDRAALGRLERDLALLSTV